MTEHHFFPFETSVTLRQCAEKPGDRSERKNDKMRQGGHCCAGSISGSASNLHN